MGIGTPEVLPCFAHGSHTVAARHQPAIINIARCIIASQGSPTPVTTLRLVGHTDASGRPRFNQRLGRLRAEAVKRAIEQALTRMTGGRPPRVTFTVQTRGESDALPGPAALSRRVEVFPPAAVSGRCPTRFRVTPSPLTVGAGRSATIRATDIGPVLPGPVTYRWATPSPRLTLSRSTGQSVNVRADTTASADPAVGELLQVTRSQPGCASVTQPVRVNIDCNRFVLARPRVIAIATDPHIVPTSSFTDPGVPGGHTMAFGQDLSSGRGRALPHGPSQGTTTTALETKMRLLLGEFASGDPHGKARRLFNAFLRPQTRVSMWSDPDLTTAAQAHPNIHSFVHRALSAPTSAQRTAGQTRIHQALRNARWDINAAIAPTNLGVPAFNLGSPEFATQDFNNGLAVMINGLQHVVVIAKEYRYDVCRNEYTIKLEYVFYDVFGLDDGDLVQFGADGGVFDSTAAQGITAWWQLQHQHGYVPLITRIAFEREFTSPAR